MDQVTKATYRARIAALEAGLKQVQKFLREKDDSGRLAPAGARLSLALVAATKTIDGDTWVVDAMLQEAKTQAFNDGYDERETQLQRILGEPTHRHKERGTLYRIAGIGNLQTSRMLGGGEKIVFYVGEDGKGWCRPQYEFYDGRFEDLKTEHRLPQAPKCLRGAGAIVDPCVFPHCDCFPKKTGAPE